MVIFFKISKLAPGKWKCLQGIFQVFKDTLELWVGFPFGLADKESAGNEGDLGLIPGLGKCPGEGKGYPLQYFGVHGVAKSLVAYEAQAGIKTAGKNINNLRYAGDTTLMAESEEELKSLLMKVKEESEKVGLNSAFRKLRSWHLVPSFHGK